jgi:KDO2-lipid IV(A) lauroyltransferase
MRLLLGLMWLLHWLPLPVLGRIAEGIGSLLFVFMKSRRRITLINLRLCLPQLSEAERKAIAKKHFQAYVRSVLERGILWWAPVSRLRQLIRIEPRMPLEQIQSGPTILLCPHFVSLDVAGIATVLETPVCSIYAPQKNKVSDQALLKGRMRFGPVKVIPRSAGVKPIIRAMREGMAFLMLPDMDFGAKDAEFVPFFGVPAATLTAPARIAASTGAKVIPVIATFLPDYQGWKITYYPAWENYPGDDIVAATRRMNEFIEARVLEAPAEYFWAHKRFKTRPEGEASLYASDSGSAL